MAKKLDKNTEVIYGAHPIIELLKAKKRRLLELYTSKPVPKAFKKIESLLPKGLPVSYVNRDRLTALAGTTEHQGVVGLTTPCIIRKKFFEPDKQPFLLMLDGIQDPRNLGGILRSAYCTGVDGVIITQKASAPLNAAAFKASAGLAEYLDIYYAPSAKAAVLQLKQVGYAIYLSMLSDKAKTVTDVTFKQPLCIVIGSEEMGISSDIKADGQAIIVPQKKADISYNASVASGILLFLAATQLERI
ncbi:MAG: TrmH family RNA methyltransferase [Candidatus Babeliales bacterium]